MVTSSALPAVESTQSAAAEPIVPVVGPELKPPAGISLDLAIAAFDAEPEFPSGSSPQSEPIAPPSGTTVDATAEVEIRSDFNDLRRELLDDRMKLVDWWLAVIAVVVTLFAVIAPIAGFFGFKRFREIEIEARKGIEITNAVVEKAEIKFEEAKRIVREIESKREEAALHTEQVTSMTVKKDPTKADQAAQSAKDDPSSSLFDRAISAAIEMQGRGNLDGAIKKWHAAAEIADGTDTELAARAWFSVGYLHAEQSRLLDAISDFDEAIRLKPDYAEAYFNRGYAKYSLDRHEMAIADFDEAIRLKPNYAEAFYIRGIAKNCLDRYDDAIADFDEAIRLKLDYAGLYCDRAQALFHLKRTDESRRDLKTAHELATATGDQSVVGKVNELVKQFFGSEAN